MIKTYNNTIQGCQLGMTYRPGWQGFDSAPIASTSSITRSHNVATPLIREAIRVTDDLGFHGDFEAAQDDAGCLSHQALRFGRRGFNLVEGRLDENGIVDKCAAADAPLRDGDGGDLQHVRTV